MEDYGFSQQGIDGTQHPRVRSDIAYHETPNGGGCFAFSSIAFCGSLPWNNCDNNISKLVGNVLNRFMKDGPLPPPPEAAFKHRGRADYEPLRSRRRSSSTISRSARPILSLAERSLPLREATPGAFSQASRSVCDVDTGGSSETRNWAIMTRA